MFRGTLASWQHLAGQLCLLGVWDSPETKPIEPVCGEKRKLISEVTTAEGLAEAISRLQILGGWTKSSSCPREPVVQL